MKLIIDFYIYFMRVLSVFIEKTLLVSFFVKMFNSNCAFIFVIFRLDKEQYSYWNILNSLMNKIISNRTSSVICLCNGVNEFYLFNLYMNTKKINLLHEFYYELFILKVYASLMTELFSFTVDFANFKFINILLSKISN